MGSGHDVPISNRYSRREMILLSNITAPKIKLKSGGEGFEEMMASRYKVTDYGDSMNGFKNILLVLDSKTKENIVLEYVESLAKKNAAHITVFSVVKSLSADSRMFVTMVPPQQLLDVILKSEQEKADAFIEILGQRGISATSKVVTGTPFIEIIRQVLRKKHDLVMMMAEGKEGIKGRLFGSTSMHLMRKCPCPVWMIKPTKNTGYERILAAVDTTVVFPDPDRKSLNELILSSVRSMASTGSTEVHVVQVWSVFGEGYMEVRGGLSDKSIKKLRQEVKREYEGSMDCLLSDAVMEGLIFIKHLPRSDNVPKAILKLAKKEKIDLLVMGTVCRTGVPGFFIGNTAETVLNEVNCSVLTLKPKGFVTPVTLEA